MLGVFKRIAAGFLAAFVVMGYMTMINSRDVSADDEYFQYYADYTEIEYVSHKGNPVTLYIDGQTIGIRSTCVTDAEIAVYAESSLKPADSVTGRDSFSFNPTSNMNKNQLYTLSVYFRADGVEQHHDTLYVVKDDEGNIRFLTSLVYEFNLERCSEWWTDEQSLKECLEPQNDIECDDPYVIAYARHITAGCETDWDKAYAIYSHLIKNFAYDNIQLEDASIVYQDDALSLLRRRITICEGLGNVFTALCRASGIPACVCFGIGSDPYDFIHDDRILNDESPNHAWAAVCLGGKWYSIDPTWDISHSFEGDSYEAGEWVFYEESFNWYLVPIEDFSMSHKICDADTRHGIESSGSCGDDATYEISRDGVLTIHGSGEIILPDGVNGFRKVVFAEDSNITSIGKSCFYDCDIVTEIILPDSVTRIEEAAFNTCEDLEYIYLPDGLEYIGLESFDYCDELAYVYIPDSVTKIERFAFDDCQRLVISVPEDLKGFDNNYYLSPAKIIYR